MTEFAGFFISVWNNTWAVTGHIRSHTIIHSGWIVQLYWHFCCKVVFFSCRHFSIPLAHGARTHFKSEQVGGFQRHSWPCPSHGTPTVGCGGMKCFFQLHNLCWLHLYLSWWWPHNKSICPRPKVGALSFLLSRSPACPQHNDAFCSRLTASTLATEMVDDVWVSGGGSGYLKCSPALVSAFLSCLKELFCVFVLPQIPFWGFCLFNVNQACDYSWDSCSADGQSCYYEKIHRYSVAYNYSQFYCQRTPWFLRWGQEKCTSGFFLMQKSKLVFTLQTGNDDGLRLVIHLLIIPLCIDLC